jgi:hypothetical protein
MEALATPILSLAFTDFTASPIGRGRRQGIEIGLLLLSLLADSGHTLVDLGDHAGHVGPRSG